MKLSEILENGVLMVNESTGAFIQGDELGTLVSLYGKVNINTNSIKLGNVTYSFWNTSPFIEEETK